MALGADTVRRIAFLARIHVEDEKLVPLAKELDSLLKQMEHLKSIDVEGVTPMTGVMQRATPLRADVLNDGNCQEDILANAPDVEEGFFTVPRVVE